MTLRRVIVLIMAGALMAACSAGPSKDIKGTVEEWHITLSPTIGLAGAVTFTVTNNGEKEHEFIIRKTDLTSDKLKLNADGTVIEDDPSLAAVGDPSEIGEIKPGTSNRNVTVTLKAGHYVVFCNLHVGSLLHYQKGMHADFTVQ